MWRYISRPESICLMRNFNKQHHILAKFYANNAPSIGNQSAKFQLNLPTQTITTASFVRSPQNVCVDRPQQFV